MRTADLRTARNAQRVYLDLEDVALAAQVGAQVLALVPRKALGPLLVTLGRTAAGMTQDGLAELTGLSRASIARMETGVSSIPFERALLLAKHLDLDPDLLVVGQ